MLVTYGGIDGHTVKTPNDLSSALGTVVDGIANEACKIDLRSSPTDPDKVQLLFDGVLVPKDGMNGWTFDPGTNLVLTVNGSYCHALTQDTARVDLVMGCLPPHNADRVRELRSRSIRPARPRLLLGRIPEFLYPRAPEL